MRSGLFRIGRARCYLLMLVEQAPWLAWTLLAVCLGLAATGFILSPWIGIAAIGFCAFLTVTALSFVIMAYGFHSVTGLNMAMHSLENTPGRLMVEFEDGKQVGIEKSDLRPYKIYPGGVLVPVAGARSGWIWIMPKAFETPEDFAGFMREIYKTPHPEQADT